MGSGAGKKPQAASEAPPEASSTAGGQKPQAAPAALPEKTLVVEIGPDGEAIERGASVEEATQIFCVVDPRGGYAIGDVKFLNNAAVLRKVMIGGGGVTKLKVFVLVPSTTSSKAHLMNAHMGVMLLGHWLKQSPSFIRVDDYYHDGDAIMKEMAEKGKRVYPTEEADSMKDMLKLVADTLWPKRAYVHWPVGFGCEEGEVAPCDEISALFADKDQQLARLGDPAPADGMATQALLSSAQKVSFLTFAEKCEGVESCAVTPELLQKMGDGELEGELGGIGDESAHPVMVAYAGDLAWGPGPSLFCQFVTSCRESKPCMPMVAVLVDESLDAFKENLWLVATLHCLIENCDMVVFATGDEVKDAVSFFTSAKFEGASVCKLAMFQLIPFPRLHFYTMGTALGAELEDGEVFLPAVTVGPATGNDALCAPEKFRAENNPFIFPGFANQERVIPGKDGFPGASLIMPGKLLCSIFGGLGETLAGKCEEGPTWAGAFGEDAGIELDDMELVEASSNLNDLKSEFQQYMECGTAEEEEEAEEG